MCAHRWRAVSVYGFTDTVFSDSVLLVAASVCLDPPSPARLAAASSSGAWRRPGRGPSYPRVPPDISRYLTVSRHIPPHIPPRIPRKESSRRGVIRVPIPPVRCAPRHLIHLAVVLATRILRQFSDRTSLTVRSTPSPLHTTCIIGVRAGDRSRTRLTRMARMANALTARGAKLSATPWRTGALRTNSRKRAYSRVPHASYTSAVTSGWGPTSIDGQTAT